jgi:thymidine kinase
LLKQRDKHNKFPFRNLLIMDFKVSDEQQIIIDNFKLGFNIQIEAVAGSGKSTTLLLCSKETKDNCLILTYSKRLQLDIEEKIEKYKLTNVNIKTIHSYAGLILKKKGLIRSDDMLMKCIKEYKNEKKNEYKNEKKKVKVLLIDELQDFNETFYDFVETFIDYEQLILVGDRRQTINQHNGSTDKYLVNYKDYFKNSKREWKECKLNISYRLTPNMAKFVNNHILRKPLIVGGNLNLNLKKEDRNIKPRYITLGNDYEIKPIERVFVELKKKYGSENICIIAKSVKPSSGFPKPIDKLIKDVLYKEIIFRPLGDDNEINWAEAKNKLQFVSYNSMKGKEADVVIVLGFDESYFQYPDKKWELQSLPNILYVAITRARKEVIIVANRNKTMRTINIEILNNDIYNKVNIAPFKKMLEMGEYVKPNISVTDLIKSISSENKLKLKELFKEVKRERKIFIPKINKIETIRFDNKLSNKEYVENPSAYYGTLIPIKLEIELTGGIKETKYKNPEIVKKVEITKSRNVNFSNWQLTEKQLEEYPENYWDDIRKIYKKEQMERTNEDWMKLLVSQNAVRNQQHHLSRQILNYDWIDDDLIKRCVSSMRKTLKDCDGIFEHPVSEKIGKDTVINGSIDFIDQTNNEIWEFKCVSSDENIDHLLQLVTYLCLSEYYIGNLYYVYTGKVITVKMDEDEKKLFLDICLK